MTAYLHLTAVPTHISSPSIAMAEMSELATALDKLEVTKKGKESPPDSSEQQTKEASPQASSSSPPASAEKQEEKKSEKSPPASEKQEEKKKTEDSPQPHEEEVTLKVGSGAASEDPSPPESKKPEDSKDPSPPGPRSQRIPRIHHLQSPNLRILQRRICLNSPPLQKVKAKPRRRLGSWCP